jgi:hypothetical protein
MVPAVTGTLLHHLSVGTQAEGITALGVEAAIGHDEQRGSSPSPARTSATPGSCPAARCCPARPSPTPCSPPPRPPGSPDPDLTAVS